jgi:hypothetical protein
MTAESREQEPLDDHPAPERTPDQPMDALSKANEVRARRVLLKRDLKSGRVSLAALMIDPPRAWRRQRCSTCCSPCPATVA